MNDEIGGDSVNPTTNSEALGALGELAAATPPPDLRASVLAGALLRRAPGSVIDALGGGVEADPIDAFVATMADFSTALERATGDEIVQPYGWTVTQLVAHLAEEERYFGRQLGMWSHQIDDAVEDDHLAVTGPAAVAALGRPLIDVIDEWRTLATSIVAHLRTLPPGALETRMRLHLIHARMRSVLVARVFELWTHSEDVARAIGSTAATLDAQRLALMTRTAVPAVPLGLLLNGIDAGIATARIVLTGPGGGVWNQALAVGATATEPDVTIVADAVDWCRLASRRLSPDTIAAEVDGPQPLAMQVLAGASVFAA